MGKNPGTLNSELNQSYGIPHVPEKTVVQVPREILRQRPDIREAERLLAQETAEIGIATAEEYPRFNLNGTFGYDSKEFDNQFSSDSRYWSFGPNFRWNILAFFSTQSSIDLQDSPDRTLPRLNSRHFFISYAVFFFKKTTITHVTPQI